mmetsp:Transcript_14712/g.28160  ORF Transcript_14712/g.28160 Transcript_14712/m.28160 type:complete len:210 (-) Transcript_14712:1173-1802(-)
MMENEGGRTRPRRRRRGGRRTRPAPWWEAATLALLGGSSRGRKGRRRRSPPPPRWGLPSRSSRNLSCSACLLLGLMLRKMRRKRRRIPPPAPVGRGDGRGTASPRTTCCSRVPCRSLGSGVAASIRLLETPWLGGLGLKLASGPLGARKGRGGRWGPRRVPPGAGLGQILVLRPSMRLKPRRCRAHLRLRLPPRRSPPPHWCSTPWLQP